jgi:hypothetical protein
MFPLQPLAQFAVSLSHMFAQNVPTRSFVPAQVAHRAIYGMTVVRMTVASYSGGRRCHSRIIRGSRRLAGDQRS